MVCSIQASLRTCNFLCHRLVANHFTVCAKYSTQLTFDTILKEENKLRTQKALQSVHPVRTFDVVPPKPGHTYAAILVPLCTVNGEPSLLFTLRSTRLKQHKGQVSFPGGNVDKTDPDFTFTALRETHEELGIDPGKFEVWGQMRQLPSSSGHKVVQPVLASITDGDLDVNSLRPSPDEVEEAFTVPLRHLCNPTNIRTTRFRPAAGNPFTLPVFTGAEHRIWGLTAVVTHMILSLLAPGLHTYKVVHKKAVHPHGHHKPVKGQAGSGGS